MTAGVFLDTDVLVYAYDRTEPAKQQRAMEVLQTLAAAQAGVVNTQVLGEFFVTVTGKLDQPLSLSDAERQLAEHLQLWKVLELSPFIVLEAVRGVREHRLNYWDGQIWATARLNQIPVVFSEDFADGVLLEGVRFVNPFAPAFRMEDWGLTTPPEEPPR